MKTFQTFLLTFFIGISAHAANHDPLSGLGGYIQHGMKTWRTPGIAVGIVQNDKVVYLKGFGVRKIGSPEKVNPETLFAIGSTSKAFTAACVATLVDDGKLHWDEPVQKLMPDFQLSEKFPSREMRVADLLGNRSGLAATSESLWYGTGFSRAKILHQLRFVPLSDGFRYQFGYRNTMFLAAGVLAGKIAGTTWDQLVTKRIFQPLKMTRTFPTQDAISYHRNVATPYVPDWKNNQPVAVSYRNMDNCAPAGAIISCARDMTQWLRLQLSNGVVDGKRILSEKSLAKMHAPFTPLATHGENPSVDLISYCLGWVTLEYHGERIVWHNGTIDGMSAYVGLVPGKKLGIVILSNCENGEFREALFYHIVDAFCGFANHDLSPVLFKKWKAARAATLKNFDEKIAVAKKKGSAPLALKSYAGTYESQLLGMAKMEIENGKLIFRPTNEMSLTVIPASATVSSGHYREKSYALRDGEQIIHFKLANGEVSRLKYDGLDYSKMQK